MFHKISAIIIQIIKNKRFAKYLSSTPFLTGSLREDRSPPGRKQKKNSTVSGLPW